VSNNDGVFEGAANEKGAVQHLRIFSNSIGFPTDQRRNEKADKKVSVEVAASEKTHSRIAKRRC
jgi:hypothetical protein